MFQEKSAKELLEYHLRREGPILEGDEKYMLTHVRGLEATRAQLSRQDSRRG